MKKILILTDFSVPAENAAKYAVTLASISRANVLICNAVQVAAEAPVASRIEWPLINYATLKREPASQLDKMVQQIEEPFGDTKNQYVPEIKFEMHNGTVLEVASHLVRDRKIDLVIMGIAGAGALTQLILGSNCISMIENATFPVLYIPYETSFKPIKTIAFATDLSLEDIPVIKVILELMQPQDPQIRLIHVTENEVVAMSEKQRKIDAFLKEVSKKISNVNITYEYVWNTDVDNGLDWISEQPDIDIIAIVHRNHNLLDRLFKGSHTQKLSRNIHIPLLVFAPNI